MFVNSDNAHVQRQLDAPMPLIGMYVALASMACSLAMAADVVNSLRAKRSWFPSKYFSLNATSLAVLAVAVKLPVDLTTHMWAVTDRLAKVSSLALVSVATVNFIPSVGSMSEKEMVLNVSALGILVATVIVNVCIQVVDTRAYFHHRILFPEEALSLVLMLLSLLLLCSSCLMISTAKRYLDAKFKELHNVFLRRQGLGAVTTNEVVGLLKKYWLMAETSSPQFVIVRSATCAASGVVCIFNALILAEALIRMTVEHKRIILNAVASSYGFSTNCILIAQMIGVIVGMIAPVSRWCIAIKLWHSGEGRRSFDDRLKVEKYWIQKLMATAKGGAPPPRIWERFFHHAKGLTLSFTMRAQIFIVISSKLVVFIFVLIISPLERLFRFIEHLRIQRQVGSIPRHEMQSESELQVLHIRRHTIRLKGETELPLDALKSIYNRGDGVIAMGRKQKPRFLLDLLKKSCEFKGMAKFDSDQVPSLYFLEPPNCWSLSVVTLASIAITLPNVARSRVDHLVSSMGEGLVLVKLVEECLCQQHGDMVSQRKAFHSIWSGVETRSMWQETDLSEVSIRSATYKDTLQKLGDEGELIVSKFKSNATDCLMRNPLNWPAEVVAANSMYRISRSILLQAEGNGDQTDDSTRLFDELCCMIADILAACLTNLFRVITVKCHQTAIEERMESVREAAALFGQTEQVLEFLGSVELPGIDAERAANIDEWRTTLMLLENDTTGGGSASGEITDLARGEMAAADHVVIAVVD